MRLLSLLLIIITFDSIAARQIDIIEYPRGHWGVDVKINDKITYPFIIDTGAQGAIFPTALVDALGKDPSKLSETIVQGAVGERAVKQLYVDSMTVGDQSVNNIEGVVLDLPFKNSDGKQPGVLPYTFLNQFTPHFDLINNKLTLHPKTKDTKHIIANQDGYTRVPFELIHGSFISFHLMLNNQTIAATLDSGAGRRIDANWAAAKLMGITPDNEHLVAGDPISGAGGKTLTTKKYDEARIQVGDLKLAKRSINFADMPVLNFLHGDKPSANVGFGIFTNRQLIIDYENQALFISKSRIKS